MKIVPSCLAVIFSILSPLLSNAFIGNGKPILPKEAPETVSIEITESDKKVKICSATVIREHLLLANWDCVSDSAGAVQMENSVVVFGSTRYPIAQISNVHLKLSDSSEEKKLFAKSKEGIAFSAGLDFASTLAMISVEDSNSFHPSPSMDAAPSVKSECSIAGFGELDPDAWTDSGKGNGVLRLAKTTVLETTPRLILGGALKSNTDYMGFVDAPLGVKGFAANNDQGGTVMCDGKIAGILTTRTKSKTESKSEAIPLYSPATQLQLEGLAMALDIQAVNSNPLAEAYNKFAREQKQKIYDIAYKMEHSPYGPTGTEGREMSEIVARVERKAAEYQKNENKLIYTRKGIVSMVPSEHNFLIEWEN